MPECVPCLSKSIKKLLTDSVAEPELHKQIADMPECPKGYTLQFCPISAGGGRRQHTETREKRAPSAYNVFIGSCMKSKPIKGKPFGEAGKFMKECAAAWKQQH